MKENRIIILLTALLLCSVISNAQVQVRNEPKHVPVLQNKYFRLLDVRLAPGDTTQFHIHSTPSLFVILSHATTAWQEKGKEWVKDTSLLGRSWYRSFTPDSLVHRVCNIDTIEFHVNDIELLSVYQIAADQSTLPFDVLFDNEKATAYRLRAADLNQKIIQDRGPMIAELVSGSGIIFHDSKTNQTRKIEAGKYLYIEPGAVFYFSAGEGKAINMVLFEIK